MERRRFPRRIPAADEPLARVRVRTGRELRTLDVSDGGVLVESTGRLLPGTHIDVHVMTSDGRRLVRSRVLRAAVSRIEPDLVHYHAALAFEQPTKTSADGYSVPEHPRS